MKKAILALGVSIACGSFSAVQALPWESPRTTIQDLDNVCWGDRLLTEVTTDFQGRIYRGSIDFGRNYKIGGCNVGDRFAGSFKVLGAQETRCEGEITVTFLAGKQAQIEWNITNLKNQTVRITSQPYNGWYRTDACGAIGYIHDEDLEFSPFIAP